MTNGRFGIEAVSGRHPVEVTIRPAKTAAALKKRMDDHKFVHIKFTDTRGGTELGVPLDIDESSWTAADFERAEGRIRLVGRLKLNYVSVKCVAEIELATLRGPGHLEIIEQTSS
jgi:hypothetical protein